MDILQICSRNSGTSWSCGRREGIWDEPQRTSSGTRSTPCACSTGHTGHIYLHLLSCIPSAAFLRFEFRSARTRLITSDLNNKPFDRNSHIKIERLMFSSALGSIPADHRKRICFFWKLILKPYHFRFLFLAFRAALDFLRPFITLLLKAVVPACFNPLWRCTIPSFLFFMLNLPVLSLSGE